MADSTVEFDMSQDKPAEFKLPVPKDDCEKIIRELELVHPMAAQTLLRLVGNDDAMSQVADLICELGKVNPRPELKENEFRVVVRYEPIPDIQELRKRFDWVNNDYAFAKFEPIEECKHVSREPRVMTMRYLELDQGMSHEDVLALIDRNGDRPALIEELLAFRAAKPDEQRKFPIIAVGSVAQVGGDRIVAFVGGDDGERVLHLDFAEGDWGHGSRFLVVSK